MKRNKTRKEQATRAVMTREQARQYRARWEAVAGQQLAELRRKSVAEKFRELNELFCWGSELGSRDRPVVESRDAWERWNQLRERCSG